MNALSKNALVMAAAVLIPAVAHAGLLSQVTDLLASNISADDESMGMLRAVIGDFALTAFNQTGSSEGAGGTVLGEMFKTFNLFVFTVAMLWFSYNCVSALAQTMHEGVILGQRMSTVWMPIRVAFGAASLMPAFGGWAFCQVLMILAATLGIAGANSLSSKAIDSAAGFQVLVNPMGGIKQAAQLHDTEKNILIATACMEAANRLNREAEGLELGQRPSNYVVNISQSASDITLTFPSNEGSSACGKIVLMFSPRSNSDLLGGFFGFRINAVNYEGIRSLVMRSHFRTLELVAEQAKAIVAGAAASTSDAAERKSAVELLSKGYLGAYPQLFAEQIKISQGGLEADAKKNTAAITEQLLQRMQSGGWATLGVWYGVFAETNEAMNEMLDPVTTFENPKIFNTSADDTIRSALVGLISASQSSKAEKNALETSSGNSSLGQAFLAGAIGSAAGMNATGYSETINPILAFKNIGDNVLSLLQTFYVAIKAVDAIPGGDMLTSAISGVATKSGGIVGAAASIASDAGKLLMPLGLVVLASAFVMSFYLPLLPFIQWFAALIQWFSSVLESLVGSSLWALAHFDADGEGMGQRTGYGYLYLLNNFARPIVLTLAFFFASATITVLGTYLFRYFCTAVGSAQGNSVTGLISIVAYLVLFAVMGMTLINSAFSQLLQMPDRIIGWIGQSAGSGLGHEVEGRVNQIFIAAAQKPAQMMAQIPGNGSKGASPQGFVDVVSQARNGGKGKM
ncbi:MAG: DotA/TraY family protein [Herbaspirillum sp.]|uniref:DotA/TraY family protein n=1 Tax=Herbaspirillum sp. TaxID=1890675 RepID=UPI00258BD420|nr:DotA/TraY family protein [Herbaspirillum sp.]MCP3655434.1 DotA/TraY family protein [Herbaspirillum sp.]MCP3945204.1 DotA/TraY family protein [Herbaspirillum sp.]MCP4034280.1 DotA/TraY family protein [Herbaspirillum sp.]MCP4034295.1 DotA/TraY family protein [Herbaspirillum sp.]